MEKLRIVWHQFRRDEQWVLVASLMLLAFFGAYALARRQSTPPLPPLFEEAPVAAKAATGNSASSPSAATVVVQVAGEVYKPGVVELPANARVQDAVRKAGGPTPRGDANALNLAARLEDGQKIVVVRRGESGAASPVAADMPAAGQSTPNAVPGAANAPSSAQAAQLSGPVNVNTAGAAQLELLPGIGPKTAALIIEYRQRHGPFRSLRDLDQVKGLGPKKLEKLAPHVVF